MILNRTYAAKTVLSDYGQDELSARMLKDRSPYLVSTGFKPLDFLIEFLYPVVLILFAGLESLVLSGYGNLFMILFFWLIFAFVNLHLLGYAKRVMKWLEKEIIKTEISEMDKKEYEKVLYQYAEENDFRIEKVKRKFRNI